MAADLIILKFESTYGGERALGAVRALEEMRYAWIDDVAVVERHRSGRYSTHTTHGSVGAGAAFGGLTGMLLGLLFPPLGFLGLFAAGAGVGALVGAAAKNAGLDKSMIDEIKSELDKGTSALVLIGASGDADQMARAFEKYNPSKVIRHAISDEAVENLKRAVDEAGSEEQADAPAEPSGEAKKEEAQESPTA